MGICEEKRDSVRIHYRRNVGSVSISTIKFPRLFLRRPNVDGNVILETQPSGCTNEAGSSFMIVLLSRHPFPGPKAHSGSGEELDSLVGNGIVRKELTQRALRYSFSFQRIPQIARFSAGISSLANSSMLWTQEALSSQT